MLITSSLSIFWENVDYDWGAFFCVKTSCYEQIFGFRVKDRHWHAHLRLFCSEAMSRNVSFCAITSSKMDDFWTTLRHEKDPPNRNQENDPNL